MAYTIGMAGEGEQQVPGPGFDWKDYLTPVVGLIIIIAIVIGIFSAIRGLTARKAPKVAGNSQVEEQATTPETNVPSSEINLGAAITNSQAQAASTPKPATQLPKTGFPGEIVAALSAVLAGVGLKLRKIRKI